MKQIGLGFAQYTQDYDERLPYAVMSNYNTAVGDLFVTDRIMWADVIQPYIKSTQLFKCPSNTNSTSPAVTRPAANGMRMSYGVTVEHFGTGLTTTNYAFAPDRFWGGTLNTTSLPEFTNASETLMVGEQLDSTTVAYGFGICPTGCAGNSNQFPGKAHLEGGNWLYADGHVKFHNMDSIYANNKYLWLRVKP